MSPQSFYCKDEDTYYKYKLVHEFFSVQWMQKNPIAPTTWIMLNPWKNRLTPSILLKLVEFIIGDYHDAFVVWNDDKLDFFHFLTSKEIAKRLYIGYQKKTPRNYLGLDETYSYGKRNGQQVKDYDKAEEQGLNDVVWSRLEKTRRRRDKLSRPTLVQFLLYERTDAFFCTLKGKDLVRGQRNLFFQFFAQFNFLGERS